MRRVEGRRPMHYALAIEDDLAECGADVRRGGGTSRAARVECKRCKKTRTFKRAICLAIRADSPSPARTQPMADRVTILVLELTIESTDADAAHGVLDRLKSAAEREADRNPSVRISSSSDSITDAEQFDLKRTSHG